LFKPGASQSESERIQMEEVVSSESMNIGIYITKIKFENIET
jgi:hypothetical protein